MLAKHSNRRILIICGIVLLLLIGGAALILTQMISKDIQFVVDGNAQTCQTNSYTVDEFLEEKKIELSKEDEISHPVDTRLDDGMKLEVRRAVPFSVRADGKTHKLKAVPDTISAVLAEHKIELGKIDKIKPAADSKLTAGMQIVINRIDHKKKSKTIPVDYKVKEQGDNSLHVGDTKVLQKGVKGQEKVTYKITYSDGKEVKRKELSRKMVKKPRTKIVAKSTRGLIEGSEYVKKFTVKAYAYTGGGRTASGTSARPGAIAVDPSVIPLGTKVYVDGYGFATAEDTGGNIKGNTIDLYKTSEAACNSWGVRYKTVYILD